MRRLLPLFLLLAACGRADLYSGLTEQHANEMIVALNEAGIGASKAEGKEGAWVVRTSTDDFAYAISVLRAADLPRQEHVSVADLFAKRTMVPTEAEDRARYTYAQSEELSRTLTAIEGVQVARVHIVPPQRDPLARETVPGSASVLIKHAPGVAVGEDAAVIKTLIVNAVQGLSYDDVSVAFFEAAPVPVRRVATPEALPARLTVPMLGALGVLALAALFAMRRRPGVPALTDASEGTTE